MTDSTSPKPPSNERRGPVALSSRPRRWLLLDANRQMLASVLTLAVFGLCIVLSFYGLIPMNDSEPVTNLLGTLLGGLLPFVTVVLAINQLILSTEFGTTGTFRNRLNETETFRRRVEDDAELSYSPAQPAEFLRTVIRAVNERGQTLEAMEANVTDTDAQEALSEYANWVLRAADSALRRLDGAEFGTFEVVSVIVDYDDPAQLHGARRLRAEHEGALPPTVVETIDELTDLLEDAHVARQYFKTVHTQQELASLSRFLLYVGLLTLLGDGFVILTADALYASLSPTATVMLASGAVALLFAPFAVLFTYVLRIATVARLTAADFGPFLLQRNVRQDTSE